MVQHLNKELATNIYQWALPDNLEVPPDELKVRLDFYLDSTILYALDKGIITTKQVSARDISMAILSQASFNSGLLPGNALWWRQTRLRSEFALWRPPKVWRVALQEDPFKPARRFNLPMPGLIFVCSAGMAPAVYAAKRRPRSIGEFIYHAPLFNVYQDGTTCAGTTKYPQDIDSIPETFFAAFFTEAAHVQGRSQKYPDDLLRVWDEVDGRKKYPLDDLVKKGTIGDLLK